ncbi:chemotaxis protein CheW [Shigella flexneri]
MTGMTNVTKLASEPSGQEFLVFTLGDEEYGIDILKVQEILGTDQVTRIQHASVYQRRHESARRYCADC